jgi:hypothetical protein
MKIELSWWELMGILGGATLCPSPIGRIMKTHHKGGNMEQKIGNQNVKELLVAANKVSVVLVKLLKDGVQFSDAVALFEALVKDAALKAEIDAALKDFGQLGAEIKDLDTAEVLELVVVQAQLVPALLEAFKKEQA